eukprot:CAMPEP_0168321854 /NCGR_PEP_ID=MMETSP0213-20121227/2532_1 /TAXON_ID=151035 /ORGANISM="Euplotes harpa, Strain FSP1.4" /LENGTH=157 /DNA_ID=CAMNT_0008323611 /DNA_START=135 /DNA_END=608 /DNA_ORIENTATION=+
MEKIFRQSGEDGENYFADSETFESLREELCLSSDENSTIDSQSDCAKNNDSFHEADQRNRKQTVVETQARKFKLISMLVKILSKVENGETCIISAFVLMDKLCECDDAIPSEDLNWTLIVCICIASKIINDSKTENSRFAATLNIDLDEFNKLELQI